ncbi:Uu.00g043800.m01.CDS01 [Anthostomella pinea]|uniref:Uu.00g043800.m01.CDS01 n=1 Tax=Anthostomella pinea TaxID=933095 RepID=A0AAI8YE96_9PEZI|nr:Uu.00g043800.m01.CDS01 [Anthostomella pinea]
MTGPAGVPTVPGATSAAEAPTTPQRLSEMGRKSNFYLALTGIELVRITSLRHIKSHCRLIFATITLWNPDLTTTAIKPTQPAMKPNHSLVLALTFASGALGHVVVPRAASNAALDARNGRDARGIPRIIEPGADSGDKSARNIDKRAGMCPKAACNSNADCAGHQAPGISGLLSTPEYVWDYIEKKWAKDETKASGMNGFCVGR